MTATYWEIGRRIVQSEQAGEKRAEYGELLIKQLAKDLSASFGRGFGPRNLAHQLRGRWTDALVSKLRQRTLDETGREPVVAEFAFVSPRAGKQIASKTSAPR
jgi:hypothetical protein